MIGKILGLQSKIEKHIAAGDHRRVRDYLLQISVVFPDLSKCPVEIKILKKAMDFLRTNGYTKSIDPKRGVIFTSPSGNSYGSLETQKDQAFWAEFGL